MTKITAFFTAIMTWLTMIFNPAVPVEGIFTETETKEQVIFDEGEFVFGENDIMVSPDGDDNNAGTVDAPIATLEKAKELAEKYDLHFVTLQDKFDEASKLAPTEALRYE